MIAIGWTMVCGRETDCHCFGQLHSAPVRWGTLLRSVVLAGVAGFVLVGGWTDAGASATGWLARLSAGALAGLCVGVLVVAAQSWFSWQLLRQNGRLLARLEAVEARLGSRPDLAPSGLPINSAAPPFALPGVDGGTLTLEHLLTYGRPVALVFSDPGCGPCTALLPEIGAWQRSCEDRITVAVISRGSSEGHRAIVAEHRTRHIGLQLDREVAEAYGAHGTPSAVLVGRDGRTASRLAVGRAAILELVGPYLSPAPETSPSATGPLQHSPLGPWPGLMTSTSST
jgi:peroxiredoxin